jgi:hypothetical protein
MPPFPTSRFSSSNCGLIRISKSAPGAATDAKRGQHLGHRYERQVGGDQRDRIGDIAGLQMARILSISTTRVLLQLPIELIDGHVHRIHFAAPCCSRQSVKPPVELPASRQIFPCGVTPKSSSAPSSFSPPRLA